MPYNVSPILRGEPTGTTQLPLSRVRKIVALDPDIAQCSNAASVIIALATEMFIQHLSEAGHTIVRSERKPRRNIQYRDLSAAVHRNDNLEFLSDIVPKTVPFKEVKGKKPLTMSSVTNGDVNGESAKEEGKGMMNGTLNGFGFTGVNGLGGGANGNGAEGGIGEEGIGNGGMEGERDDKDDSTIADPSEQLRMEDRGVSAAVSNGSSVANGRRGSEDVEMEG